VRDASRSAFEDALRGLLVEIPTPHALFEGADESLVLANPAFFAEFGVLPDSRASFAQRFEPVSVTAHDGDPDASPEARADGQRTEVFCPGSGRWYVLQWSRLHRPDGGELALLTAQNLTERMDNVREQRALQEQLLVSSRVMSVGEMATTLAHEINQPLATIINCLTAAGTLLERRARARQRSTDAEPRGREAEHLRQTLELAREQAEQAAAVVARIREFVRTREPRRELLCVRALIERVVQLQQLDAQKSRVRIRTSIAADLPPVFADRVMVEQVLANLVRNAIEAMHAVHPAERVLTISGRTDAEGRAEVRVADRGLGIASAEEAQLFTPFFTTKPNGMGIGLAICRSIAEFHDGHLYFERGAAGGSVFVFVLPATPAS
jgi:signal transduction histidine kinase